MSRRGPRIHLNQIQLAYNSNRIEGSRLSEEQTRYLFETRTVSGDALVVGGWKQIPNEVGGIRTTPPALVESDIQELVEQAPARMAFEDIVDYPPSASRRSTRSRMATAASGAW